MKTFLSLILALCVSLPMLAQNSETRALTGFTKLSIGVPAEVRLSKGPFKVQLEGDDLDEIETQVKGDQLVIKRKNDKWSFFGNNFEKVVIYISMPSLEAVALSGSGKLESKDQFSASHMKLNVSGSGRMHLPVAADKLDAHVSGSGDIETSGTASVLNAHISGSGKVMAEGLRASEVEVHISGSGNCSVHADNKLDAHISGSGNVNYTGSPTSVNARTSGSGKINKRG
ncbi:head GIN domain-containing protein [Cesiribacter sp. SM1]|uniref:head GIN domain-containing protein n=1 Tax=Cesiribacter sp. SM1 TaxID=2861196 RepID=UPI001CD5046C|nr:head GIN domain-containing protein [Cesiribacter sp. SM1]